jgi:phosphoglycerate dehydrogenase-like enzyme
LRVVLRQHAAQATGRDAQANLRHTPRKDGRRMNGRRKTLANLGDRDIDRTVTILGAGLPAIAGLLVGTSHIGSRVGVVLDVFGMRVRLDPLPADTACVVSPRGTTQ